jgi:hypothetical protein
MSLPWCIFTVEAALNGGTNYAGRSKARAKLLAHAAMSITILHNSRLSRGAKCRAAVYRW